MLNSYLLKYINEYSGIDLHKECQSDSQYMKKYREANALLDLIEAKAKELNKKEILEKFIWPRRRGISIVSFEDCKN